ncbi:MAG: Coenzyme F420 hydrogenase/dehydrogenase, beta subunit C-terminal domain [Bacteroidales bacterium]|nr:Coenzyme F420 hydrogenase/dehydrogenase, beta subunit C-terminal domain [Bacteroidales bacterium]
MIQLTDKKDCCGCFGCKTICPKQCISMEMDNEGFHYPKINYSLCIDCGLCNRVCPVLNRYPSQSSGIRVFACKNQNEPIRLSSSSGGIFSLLAEDILARNGVVFGARFDSDYTVYHDYTEKISDLPLFRGSKYMHSRIEDSYKKAERFLKDDRQVLFTGTPCHIAGLKHFLRKDYDNLLAVDVICHGSPSPAVFKKYVNELTENEPISDIQFRDKTEGWSKYSFCVTYTKNGNKIHFRQPAKENNYMRGFIKGLYLRPSCHDCPSKNFTSGSDLTLADYWGIDNIYPEMNDGKGISMVVTYTDKGYHFFNSITPKLEIKESSPEHAKENNPAICVSVEKNPERESFFKEFASHSFSDSINQFILPYKDKEPTLYDRIKWKWEALQKSLRLNKK